MLCYLYLVSDSHHSRLHHSPMGAEWGLVQTRAQWLWRGQPRTSKQEANTTLPQGLLFDIWTYLLCDSEVRSDKMSGVAGNLREKKQVGVQHWTNR